MLKKIKITKRLKAGAITRFLSKEQKNLLVSLVKNLSGRRIVHINATAVGGGVAEILKSLVPYLRALGLDIDWYAIDFRKNKRFFEVTNKIHNALQGAAVLISTEEWELYKKTNEKIAEHVKNIDYDLLVVNDPQPLYLAAYVNDNKPKIYYSHIDTSTPNNRVWRKILPVILSNYLLYIFSNREFVNQDLPRRKVRVFTPAIDPFALKQKIVPKSHARRYLKRFGVPEKGPLVVQVSRFDVWKNPYGLVKAFRRVEADYPDAHLLFVGLKEAKDNPEAEQVFRSVKNMVGKDKNIHLFFDAEKIGIKNIGLFTMYAQNGADIIVQNSIREGFGLTVSEALWKRKAVIGGPASGIRKQIRDGVNGYIVKSDKELAERIKELINSPSKRKELGERGREVVIKKFLFPRLVLDHLRVYWEAFRMK